jgi:hypothetical protein
MLAFAQPWRKMFEMDLRLRMCASTNVRSALASLSCLAI